MIKGDDDLLRHAQWAADCLLRSGSGLTTEVIQARQWILQNPLHVRELLMAAALDLELRIVDKHKRADVLAG